MDATNNIATDLFYKVRSRFQGLKLGNETGEITINPEEARFFDFDYMEGQNPIGHVSISLAEPSSMKVYFSSGITEAMDGKNGYEAFPLKSGLQIKPEVGDILCYGRNGGSGDSHCDIIYKIVGHKAYLIGGNLGDTVETKYGLNKIKKIELMPEPRHYSKCGINVEKMFTNMKNYCIIDLDNKHFVYGDEIERIG